MRKFLVFGLFVLGFQLQGSFVNFENSSLKVSEGETSVHCDPVSIGQSYNGYKGDFYISVDGEFDNGKTLEQIYQISLTKKYIGDDREREDKRKEIDVKVSVTKSMLFDSRTYNEFRMMRRVRTEMNTYAVMFKISSDDIIGSKISGCYPVPVKEMEVSLICRESTHYFEER